MDWPRLFVVPFLVQFVTGNIRVEILFPRTPGSAEF